MEDVRAVKDVDRSGRMPDSAEILRVDVGAELDPQTFALVMLVLDELAELLASADAERSYVPGGATPTSCA